MRLTPVLTGTDLYSPSTSIMKCGKLPTPAYSTATNFALISSFIFGIFYLFYCTLYFNGTSTVYKIFKLSHPLALTVNVNTPGCDHIPVLAVKSIDLSKLGD